MISDLASRAPRSLIPYLARQDLTHENTTAAAKPARGNHFIMRSSANSCEARILERRQQHTTHISSIDHQSVAAKLGYLNADNNTQRTFYQETISQPNP